MIIQIYNKCNIFFLKERIKKGEKLIFKCEKNDKIKNTIENYGLYIMNI